MTVGRIAEDDDMLTRVRELRAEGRTPKAIARTLGVQQSTVTRLVRQVAAEVETTPAWQRPVVGCWVSQGWSTGLTVRGQPNWPRGPEGDDGSAGFASVAVVRRTGPRRLSFCGYLVDVYCLGVKDALGPQTMTDSELPSALAHYYSAFAHPPLDIPLEMARHVVWGAVDYARGLGFEPHPDFEPAADHLGPWEETSAITFGREGTPFYVNGPHDHAEAIIDTLRKSVGDDNFHYSVGIGL